MENWKKVILGVVLSFMALFTCVGYAALNDTLTISGILNASMPDGIFITGITKVDDGSASASISGLREITASGNSGDTAIYSVTVYNNTSSTYVYTGVVYTGSLETTSFTGEDGNTDEIPSNSGDGYVSGTPIEPGGKFTFYVQYTLTESGSVTVEYLFKPVIYTITYINNGVTLDTRCVYDNSNEVDTANTVAQAKAEADMGDGIEFGYWMNAGNSQVESISAGYPLEEDDSTEIVLYPKFNNLYTAMFVDQDGSLFSWCFFNSENYETNVEAARLEAESALEANLSGDLELDYWQVVGEEINQAYDINKFAGYATDVTIYPYYMYKGDVKLIPVDEDGDGDIEYYQVGGYNDPDEPTNLVEIPAEVNGIPVTTINSSAFASYDDLHAVRIPATITSIGAATFSDSTTDRQTVTLYYEGDADLWARYMDLFYADKAYSYYTDYNELTEAYSNITKTILTNSWDSGMGEGSRVFFLDRTTGRVDQDAGYWELCNIGWKQTGDYIWNRSEVYVWIYHNHTFPYDSTQHSCNYEHNQNDTDYDGACTCSSCNGADRPDADYWKGVTTTTLEETPDVTEAAEIQLIWDGIDTTNLVWYPLDEQNPVPGDSYEIVFEPAEGYVMAEILTVFIDDTEYAVQTDSSAPEGETVPTYDPERNVLTIPAALLTAETKMVSILALAVPAEETDPTEETAEATDPTEETAEATDPTEETAEATDPTEETAEATDPTEETAEATDSTEETAGATDPTEETAEATDPTEETAGATDPTE